jgi:hypothetical protein
MPSSYQRYYFDVNGPGENNVDRGGTPLPSDDAAFHYATHVIRELKESGDFEDPACIMVVRHQNGGVVFSIPF